MPTLNMFFFQKSEQLQSLDPCFLTPPQCFVQQQEKAYLPALNMPFLHKVQLVQTPNPCWLTIFHRVQLPQTRFALLDGTSMLCSAARESPLAHPEHALRPQSPTSTNPRSMLLDPTSILCSAARESPLAHSELDVPPQSPTCTNPGSMILDPISMICAAARESLVAYSEHAPSCTKSNLYKPQIHAP